MRGERLWRDDRGQPELAPDPVNPVDARTPVVQNLNLLRVCETPPAAPALVAYQSLASPGGVAETLRADCLPMDQAGISETVPAERIPAVAEGTPKSRAPHQ